MGIIDNFMQRLGYRKMQSGAVTERVPLAMAGQYQWERDPSWLLQNDALYQRIGWIFTAVNAVTEYGAASSSRSCRPPARMRRTSQITRWKCYCAAPIR